MGSGFCVTHQKFRVLIKKFLNMTEITLLDGASHEDLLLHRVRKFAEFEEIFCAKAAFMQNSNCFSNYFMNAQKWVCPTSDLFIVVAE